MSECVRRAFTLMELMIVVLILGVLLALLGPTVQNTWVVADHYRCTRNLSYLYQAITMRRTDLAVGSKSDLKTRWWPTQLMPYMDNGAPFLVCPAADAEESEMGGGGSGGDGYDSGSGSGGSGQDQGGQNPPKAYPPIPELCELRLGNGSYQPMDAGPWTLKLSEEQYQTARGMGYLAADSSSHRYLRDKMNTTYNPGPDPYVFYLCFEDNISTGGDQDFQDTLIRVVDKQDGSYELTISGHTAGKHSLVSKPDREVLLPLAISGYYQNQQIMVGQAEAQEEQQQPGGSGGGFSGSQYGSAQDPATIGSVIVSTNYAMNGDFPFLTYRAGRVALLDYSKYLFHATDIWSEPSMDPNGDGVPIFARHWGQINALMTDGSVQLMLPEDLDPARPETFVQYWTQ